MANEFITRRGLISLGGVSFPYISKTASYSITDEDYFIDCSGTFSVTLPTSVGKTGRIYVVKNSGSGTVTVNTTSFQTIDGGSIKSLIQNQSVTVQSNGLNWLLSVDGTVVGATASGTSGTSGTGTSGTSGVGTSGTSGTGTSGTSGTGTSGTSGNSVSFALNGNVNNRVVTMTGTASTLDGESNLTFDGTNLVVSGSYDLISDPTSNIYLSSDNTSYGDIVNFGNTTTVPGEVYYLNTGGTWSSAQADVLLNGGNDLLAIAVGSNSTNDGMLIRGFFRSSLFTSGNIGEPLFLSSVTPGRVVNTVPSSVGNIVRVIGYVVGNLTNRRIYFNPSQDWIEL